MHFLPLFLSFNLFFFTLLQGMEKARSSERKTNNEIQIGHQRIGPDHPPFIVAKLWGNHIGSLQKALAIVEAAKEAGAHAVKLQTFTPDTMTLDIKEGKFLVSHPQQKSQNISLYDIYEEAYTAWEWHKPIFELCHQLGLICYSTPFDDSAVDFLEMLGCPCYKISSLDIVNHPLIKKVAATGKPLMLSTGGATIDEIQEAVAVARKAGCKDLILFKCTSSHPVDPVPTHAWESNLRTIPHMMQTYDTLVGLSDYTKELGVSIASVALGCCIIEKALTIHPDRGHSHTCYLNPSEFGQLVKETKRAWEAMGRIHYGLNPHKSGHPTLRPSLHFVQDLRAGERIDSECVRCVRPSGGLPPKDFDKIIGLQLHQSVKKGTPVTWDLFKP